MATEKKILFVLSGGGLPGLDMHAGMVHALSHAGIHPTDIRGTSAGAIVGSMLAAGHSSNFILGLTQNLETRDVIGRKFAHLLLSPFRNHTVKTTAIKRLLAEYLPESFSELKLPLAVMTLNERRADRYRWSYGDQLREVVLASMSIAGIFPPVHLFDGCHVDGSMHSDGGTVDNIPVPRDWAIDFDEVYVLDAGRPLDFKHAHGNVISRLLWNLDIAAQDRASDLKRRVENEDRVCCAGKSVVWLRPNLPAPKGALCFDHGLIERAYEYVSNRAKNNFENPNNKELS